MTRRPVRKPSSGRGGVNLNFVQLRALSERMQHWKKIKYVFQKENLLVALVYAFMFITGSILGRLLLTSTVSEIQSKAANVDFRVRPQSTTPWPQFITSQSHQIKNSRILCWVLTSPQNTFKAAVVRDTWGRKCDKLLFMSSVNDTSLPAIGLPVKESREMLWEKVKMSVHHLYTHHLNYYDWFFKADDDTFTIVENLRRFLSPYNSSEPYFIGREFETNYATFFSGGSGYLLSKEALRRIVESGFAQNKCRFKPKDTSEDVNMAKCVKEVNGTFGSSTDEFGRQRFMPFRLEDFYSGKSGPGVGINWMRSKGIQFKLGYECCSNEAITFHYVSGHDMQMYNYLLYGVKIDNVSRKQT